jgi:uncharacterized membrane protein HdeD (DUF308 family)
VLLLIGLVLLCWVAVSLAVAPLVGIALRRMDVLEDVHDVAVLRAKAQHPARHAA